MIVVFIYIIHTITFNSREEYKDGNHCIGDISLFLMAIQR